MLRKIPDDTDHDTIVFATLSFMSSVIQRAKTVLQFWNLLSDKDENRSSWHTHNFVVELNARTHYTKLNAHYTSLHCSGISLHCSGISLQLTTISLQSHYRLTTDSLQSRYSLTTNKMWMVITLPPRNIMASILKRLFAHTYSIVKWKIFQHDRWVHKSGS